MARAEAHVIRDVERLRSVVASPSEAVLLKLADRVNPLTAQFIERSPFVLLGTASPDGGLDVSPRGDPALLARSAVEDKVPTVGLLVTVEEAYTQCPKALLRSDLWNPERFIGSPALPSSGEILRSLANPDSEFDAAAYDRERAGRYERREGFY